MRGVRATCAAWRGMSADLRAAIMGLARQPGFALAVVVLLGFGIGASAAAGTGFYRMVMRPLPYNEADELVTVGLMGRGQGAMPIYRRVFEAVRSSNRSFTNLAGYARRSMVWSGPDGPVRLHGVVVSPEVFSLLRVGLHTGRRFTQEDARFGAQRVLVLSHVAWRIRFGADPEVVGSLLELGGRSYAVVGVLAEGVAFPDSETEFWVPMVLGSPDRELDRIVASFSALGRLGDGVTASEAAAEMDVILERSGGLAALGRARVIPWQRVLTEPYRPALLALTGAAGLMLLLVAVNVAGLLLARVLKRSRELATRCALGASAGRIVRGMLLEGVLLGLAGGVVGIGVATGLIRAGAALTAEVAPGLDTGSGATPAIALVAALSMGVGLLSGAAPAFHWWWRLSRICSPQGTALHRVDEGSRRVSRARAGLVVMQISCALALVIAAALLLRSFLQLVDVDPGYEPADVLTARVGYPDRPSGIFDGVTTEQMYRHADASLRFFAAMVERLATLEGLAGVEAVGVSSWLPLGGLDAVRAPVEIAEGELREPLWVPVTVASPGYFAALRPHVRAGRVFTHHDVKGPPVAVVSESVAREVLGDPAVGQSLVLMAGTRAAYQVEVIGVVADVRALGLQAQESAGGVYVSVLQPGPFTSPDEWFVTIRTDGDPTAMAPFLRSTLGELHPRAMADDVRTMSARLAARVAEPRAHATVAGLFGGGALAVATFGLYGLVSQAAWRRRREFGVRLALGAQRGHILRLVLGWVFALVGSGVALGLAISVATARVLQGVLFGVASLHAPTVATAMAAVLGVGLAAAYLPARRAARAEPMDVLRRE